MTIKVGDIFILSRRPLKVARVIRAHKKAVEARLSYISSKDQTYPIWLSNKMLEGYKKATKKDWYRAVRQYNECRFKSWQYFCFI